MNTLKVSLWKQFCASIDMLKHAILLGPEEYLDTDKKFFYTAYHSLLFLDYYLTVPPKNFSSPLPFTITESAGIPAEALDDIIPNRCYGKKELLDYLKSSRNKCHQLIAGLTTEKLSERWREEPDPVGSPATLDYSILEILLYNMRHVQHHAAQLNLLLRQGTNKAAAWLARAEDDL